MIVVESEHDDGGGCYSGYSEGGDGEDGGCDGEVEIEIDSRR